MTQARPSARTLALAIFAVLAISITVSLGFKPNWLWMDEVLSYTLISDPSLHHMNDAVVSGMDANPPLFVNIYWLVEQLGHPGFLALRALSVVLFAASVAGFYRYTTRWVGSPLGNFFWFTLVVGLTYLNFTLSTQIRSYALFLAIGAIYFIACHQLLLAPAQRSRLVWHFVTGVLLAFAHNFGLFYLAASGAFFALWWLWSRQGRYFWPLVSHALVVVIWLLVWFPKFRIQAQAGLPHSWIPLPTIRTFFGTVGDLAPTFSSRFERAHLHGVIPVLRFVLVPVLYIAVAGPRLRRGFDAIASDGATIFFLFAGFIYFGTIVMALVVSFVHTSVFLSRYLWPSHLLLLYMLVYIFGGSREGGTAPVRPAARWLWPALAGYLVVFGAFLFYQNRKLVLFPSGIVPYIDALSPRYPVFVESADYMLPIWLQDKSADVRYLLDWDSVSRPGNILGATVEYKILDALREKYGVENVVRPAEFNAANYPHFYCVDESAVFLMEHYLRDGQVNVVREIPVPITGHRIIECTFAR